MADIQRIALKLTSSIARASTGVSYTDAHTMPADVELGLLNELGALVDERRAELVGQLRAAGRSWTEIAEVLGVSRQGARQRFGSKPGTD